MTFECHGLLVGIRFDDPDLLGAVLPHLVLGSRPVAADTVDHLYSVYVNRGAARRGTRSFALLYFGTERLARSLDLAEVLGTLGTHLHQLVGAMSSTAVFVEDAAVVVRQGAATVLVGGDAASRNDVAAAWVTAGALCYSTDSAVFDLSGRACSNALDATHPSVSVAAVLIGDTGARRPISPGQALLALLARTPSACVHPKAVLLALRRVVQDVSLLTGDWTNSESLASDLAARTQSTPYRAKELQP